MRTQIFYHSNHPYLWKYSGPDSKMDESIIIPEGFKLTRNLFWDKKM